MDFLGQAGQAQDIQSNSLPQVEAPLAKSVARLLKAIEILEDKQAKLRARLEPFRRNMAYPSAEGLKRPPQSKVCEAIENFADRIMSVNEETQRTLDTLDF